MVERVILSLMQGKMSKDLSFDTKNENLSKNETVTVKFRTDTNETLTQAFNLEADIGSLRSHLLKLLNVDPFKIVIERDELKLQDTQTLKELGATSLGIFELNLRGDGIRLIKPAYYLPVVDVITVNVKQRRLIIEIEYSSVEKPWLGGYRNKNNSKEYHHAVAQTDFKPKLYLNVIQADRHSQTCADKGINHSVHSAWTQTTDGRDGRILLAKKYQSYQTWLQQDYVLSCVLKIQRAFRRMLERKELQHIADMKRQRIVVQSEPSLQITTALESKQQHFYSLYTMIGKWWKKERQRIKEIEAENARKAAQMNLLKKEIKFLLEMEKQRSELKYELTKHDDITFLNKTSKPKMFKNKRGKLLTIDTVGNQKARILRDIYVKIAGIETADSGSARDKVLDELLTVVSKSSYKYKKNLMDAIVMEKEFGVIGVNESSMRSVRSRVEQMFRHFIRQPEVNPEADTYYRPSEKRILNIYTCIRCKRNLAATDFSLESRVNRTNVCANCEWTEQVGHKRIDIAPYRRMLKALRHDEIQATAYSSECFLMQPTEVYRLVSVVWKERSAISECSQLNMLRLVRWRRHEQWSPWNCVLLTRSEAEAHCRLEGDLTECYNPQFIQSVINRHLMARLQFSNLVQAVDNRSAGKPKTLSKNWKIVADNFKIKTST